MLVKGFGNLKRDKVDKEGWIRGLCDLKTGLSGYGGLDKGLGKQRGLNYVI